MAYKWRGILTSQDVRSKEKYYNIMKLTVVEIFMQNNTKQ